MPYCTSCGQLLKDGAKLAKGLKADYKPRFKSKDEYVAFMDKFNSVKMKLYGRKLELTVRNEAIKLFKLLVN